MQLIPFKQAVVNNCNSHKYEFDSPSFNMWLYDIMIHRYNVLFDHGLSSWDGSVKSDFLLCPLDQKH